MREDFLHYLWKYQLIKNLNNLVVNEQKVEVLNPGEYNTDAGPDFFNAKIKWGETIWVGNVEVHVKASDWKKHKHHLDKAYNNTILHVVHEKDDVAVRENGEEIPSIEIGSFENMLAQFNFLMESKHWVPCETFIHKMDDFTFLQWKERLLVERLQSKSRLIIERFERNGNNFEETFYQTLAANMGFKTNAFPFEQLAQSLPINYLAKHKDDIHLLEAMLFGQAGLIPTESEDDYVLQLQKDYKHLKQKFQLKPLHAHLWKFMRMRPANFPSLRIAQFAALIYQSSSLFSKIIEAEKLSDIKQLFQIKASKYWDTHYVFNKESEKKEKILGNTAFNNLIINTVAPTLFFYGNIKGLEQYYSKAMDLLMELKAEDNNIIRAWKDLGLNVEHAFDSQALIQLKNVYCKNRNCLNCRVGNQVIKHNI